MREAFYADGQVRYLAQKAAEGIVRGFGRPMAFVVAAEAIRTMFTNAKAASYPVMLPKEAQYIESPTHQLVGKLIEVVAVDLDPFWTSLRPRKAVQKPSSAAV